MLTTQQLHDSYNELRTTYEIWDRNNKIGKKNETYIMSHKLVGLLLVSWSKEVQTGDSKRLDKVFDDLQKGNEVIVHDMVIKKPVSRGRTPVLTPKASTVIASAMKTAIASTAKEKKPHHHHNNNQQAMPQRDQKGRFLSNHAKKKV